MGLTHWVARHAVKALGDRMTADQLVTSVFGPNTSTVRYGTAEILRAFNTMPWLRAIVERTSWTTACVPWQLFVATEEPIKAAERIGRRAKAVLRSDLARSTDPDYRIAQYKSLRQSDTLREIKNHVGLQVLDRGNPRFAGQVVRQVTQQHLDLVGEGAWLVERDGLLVPKAFYPIPPTWIQMTPWTVQRFDGTEPGTWLITSNRGSMTVPEQDLIYFYHPNPADPYDRGTGIGMALGDELETDEATAKHLKRWFKNFAIPPLIISRKGGSGTGNANTQRLEEAWMQRLLGRNNTPYFSNQEVEVKELNQTFNDMQLSQLRKDERDILIHVYGMPPEIFGILENSNRSTIDAADYLMAKYVIVPRLEFLRINLQYQLFERFDNRLILDYVSPIVEDKEFQLKTMQASPHSFTVDELRELAARKPLPNQEGEGFVAPLNVQYVKNLQELGLDQTPGE